MPGRPPARPGGRPAFSSVHAGRLCGRRPPRTPAGRPAAGAGSRGATLRRFWTGARRRVRAPRGLGMPGRPPARPGGRPAPFFVRQQTPPFCTPPRIRGRGQAHTGSRQGTCCPLSTRVPDYPIRILPRQACSFGRPAASRHSHAQVRCRSIRSAPLILRPFVGCPPASQSRSSLRLFC